MATSRLLMLGALVVLASISAAAARHSDRIVEHDIASTLPGSDQLLKDVPLIDPPRRTAGKLGGPTAAQGICS